ncbi:hypothetical protein Syun_031196 [Stephania yunnanensis]|uniref:Uncharacterized protein n=1 Tax=Stephania yunnanensis TaxID=152371 RepID=A0AAP0HG92_9MAGN
MEGADDDDGDGGKGVIKEGRELEEDQGFVDLIGLHEREAPSMEENRGGIRFSDDEDRKDRKGVNVEDEENDNEPFGSIQDFSPWKEMEGHGGGDDDESLDSDSDSDSDGAESSSPDASMADIIPMLDELHPLLDAGAAQPTFIPLNDSDAASQRSHGSNEHQEEEEDEDDDEEEEAQRGLENAEAKPVVHWTEDDERNLMDLGNSELERNRRLESLIARRRARKKFGAMLAERNLIDLDGGELPFPIAPISTARRNPFDIHYDSNEAMGLPPIPGSAPSVLLPRRNPFDLPYDPLEERPDLTGGSFEEEFLTSHEKDAFFRRHESFSLGSSSFFGESKQEKQRSKFRPYFVAEHSDREGFPMFQRQLSGRSDSRVSSIAETESLSPVAEQDRDHKSLNEQELSQEDKPMHPINELSERVSYPMFQRQLSEISDSKVSSVAGSESHSLVAEEVDHKSSNEHELSREDTQLPDDDLISSGNKTVDGEDVYERHPNLLNVEPELARDYLEAEVSEKQYIRSSSSSSSEETEKIFHVNVDEANQDPANDENEVHSNSSTGSSAVDSDHAERVVNLDDNQPKEPVYDWSPVEKSLSGISIIREALYVDKGVLTSTSSVESDKRVDVMQSHLVERTFSPADGDFSLHHDNTADEGTSGLEGSWTASSHMSAVEENEMMSREVTVISEHDVIKIGFSGDVQNSHDPPVQTVPSVVERILSRNDSSTSEMESEDEKTINEEREPQFQQAEASSSLSLKQEMDIGAPEYETDEADVKAFIDSGEPSEYLVSNTSDKLPLLFEESTVISSSDEESKEPQSPRETSINDVDVVSEFDEVVVYDHEHENSSDISPSASGPSSSFPQLLVPQPDIEDVLHDAPENETSSPVIKRLDVQHEVISSQLSEEEVDAFKEIKEIDERLLTELDAVSDFHVEERVTNTSRTANDLAVGHVSEADSAENIENASENSVEPQVGVELPLEKGAQPLDGIVEEQHPSASGRSTFELHVDMASPSEEIGTASEERSQGVLESSFSHEDRLRKEMEATYAIVKPLNDGPTQMQPVEELAGIKARCLEVKDFNSGHESEGEPEKPLIPKLDEVPSVEEAEASSSELKVSNQHSNYIADTLEMPILEARSLEDIDLVFKQVQKGEENEPIHDTLISDTTESDSAYIEHSKQDLIEMEPSAAEERSVEDKQIEGRVTEKLVTLEPIPDAAVVQESKVQSSELRAAERVPDSVDFDPELQLFEARSVEDVNAALSELSEGNDPNKQTCPETMDSIGSGSEPVLLKQGLLKISMRLSMSCTNKVIMRSMAVILKMWKTKRCYWNPKILICKKL